MMTPEALNKQFGLRGQLRFYSSSTGLVLVEIDNRFASALVCLQGAQVLHYQPVREEPVLWVSEYTHVKPGKAIRGGIPVCWPWFGPHPSDKSKPAHGFARLESWEVLATGTTEEGYTRIVMGLNERPSTRALWNLRFNLQLTVTVGPQLEVSLVTHNPAAVPFIYTGALHSYFDVADVKNIEILGLDGHYYIDKLDNGERKLQQGPVTINDATDRIYINTSDDCLIRDPGKGRIIRVAKEGSRSTVAWNPWMHKAQAMEDFGDHEFHDMVCVETCNVVNDLVRVSPGKSHILKTIISVEPLRPAGILVPAAGTESGPESTESSDNAEGSG